MAFFVTGTGTVKSVVETKKKINAQTGKEEMVQVETPIQKEDADEKRKSQADSK